jgi:hypothetical protein
VQDGIHQRLAQLFLQAPRTLEVQVEVMVDHSGC